MWDMRGAYSIQVGRTERKKHLKILGVDGRIILELSFNTCNGDMDWIDLALANAAINL
jgi:hypothetical protein